MAISSLGVGSGILTQDLLDKLRKSDEAGRVTPIDLNIANEKDKKKEFDIVDANMTNLIDSITELKTPALFDERTTTINGTSVEITADANSDLQDFTLNVTQLATKQIEESGSFSANTAKVATAAGNLNLNVNGTDYTISYDATTTLDDLKKSINNAAGTDVNATVVQVASGDYRLFVNSANTGSTQDITITDTTGNLSDDGGSTNGGTKLTTDFSAVQTGVDANFTYNGQAVVRTSNDISDLVTGYNITLKEVGTSVVSVEQNRDNIMSKIDSFVEKYNAAMTELSKTTVSSTDSSTRGIFSGESAIKSMKDDLRSMIDNVGGGVGTLYDYGFDIDKDGKLSVDKTTLNDKLDANTSNVETFFSGGDFDNGNGTTTAITGSFAEMATIVQGYTDFNKGLDQYKEYLTNSISSLEESKTKAVEKLDAKYEILHKQFTAFDAMINKLNSSSSLFTQLANSSTSSSSN